MQKILAIFAHPDDEAFGPGGTIALWSQQGKEVYLLCATKGEAGKNHLDNDTAEVRAQELINSAKILGIKSVTFLNYTDGEIGNNQMVELETVITKYINEIKPDALLTFNLNGVSGHLDHIAVASATTKAFQKSHIPQKIYYYTESKDSSDKITDYFVYFPPGAQKSEVDEIIDISSVWDIRTEAMNCHKSQQEDIDWILEMEQECEKVDFFMILKK